MWRVSNIFLIPCILETILEEAANVEFDDFSDISDADSDLPDTDKICKKIEVVKTPNKVKDKYTCNFCQMKFSNKFKFLGHQRMHDETKPFKCSLCLQSFSKQVNVCFSLKATFHS